MSTSTLIFAVLFLTLFSYWFGIQRSIKVAGGVARARLLASLPRQFGTLTGFWCALPALIVLLIWNAFETTVIQGMLIAQLPSEIQALPSSDVGLYINDIYNIAAGLTQESLAQSDNPKTAAALYLLQVQENARWMKSGLVLVVAVGCVAFILSRFRIDFKARVQTEKIIQGILMACSGSAVLIDSVF